MSMSDAPIVAVVPVRDGVVAPGGVEVAARSAAAGGRVVLAGAGTPAAVSELVGLVAAVEALERTDHPTAWPAALAAVVGGAATVALPASPDGRDLAPLLAATLDRPLVAGVVDQDDQGWVVSGVGGLAQRHVAVDGPVVVTLQPGLGHPPRSGDTLPELRSITPSGSLATTGVAEAVATGVEVLEVLPPDPATTDLAEAPRIVGAGAGLTAGDDQAVAARMELLGRVGEAMGASLGATRVVTDAGWIDHERQIGTTGVVVDPRLYVAFAVSGAVQHTAGLGRPDHVISVNLDPHCPMMALADLAVVADANATLDHLAELLGVTAGAAGAETSRA